MSQQKLRTVLCFLMTIIFLTALTVIPVKSQTDAELGDATKNFLTLYGEKKYVEALPYAETLVKALPDNSNLQFMYGACLLAKSKNAKDKEEAKQFNVMARQAFIKSKQLGNTDKIVDALIASIPEDGSISGNFSKNEAAEKAMSEGEAFFGQGKMDEALSMYQKALELDPKIYEAALFSGDVYMEKKDYANAEIWYQKAIVINPDRETAYRYSATPLMKENKYDLALERYVEAYITEPFNKFSTAGLTNWAQVTKTQVGHPKIDVPEIKIDENGKASSTLNFDPADDSSIAWAAYIATRETWRKDKFAKTFPNEKTYRHSLQEEADALRSVIKLVKEKGGKSANPQISVLMKLEEAGLLEPYILLALTDDGIYQDYPLYLKNNREKLRQYVMQFVVEQKTGS